jgi:hypothetical protein
MAAELGCEEMTTFIIGETDLTIGWDPTTAQGKPVTFQIKQTWDDKSTNNAAIWCSAAVARRIAKTLLDAAAQCDPTNS